MKIESALKQVKDRVSEACRRTGRDENDVGLVAVSKTFPMDAVREAFHAGQRVFGESKAQELRDKALGAPEGIEWHFIGHLQSNKIKYAAPPASLIHSIDSLHLARQISDFAGKKGMQISILMQVNTSGESSKFGIAMEEAEDLFLQVNETMPNLQLKGMMCMAPFVDDSVEIRKSFTRLRLLKESLAKKVDREKIRELSMGMSQDYEIAIEEGSTLVRVGTAIFGGRGRIL